LLNLTPYDKIAVYKAIYKQSRMKGTVVDKTFENQWLWVV